MSEYLYYEFCKLDKPISKECRDEMKALSKRAKLNTHGVQYTYNYGDFSGNKVELLAKYFDVFFHNTNFGDLVLMFRYDPVEINFEVIKPHLLRYVVDYKQINGQIIITLTVNNQNGGFDGWLEGEDLLAELLPLYDELKNGNDQILQIFHTIHLIYNEDNPTLINGMIDCIKKPLSPAQQALLSTIDLDLFNCLT